MKCVRFFIIGLILILLNSLTPAQVNNDSSNQEKVLGALYLDEEDALRSSNEMSGTKLDCTKIQKLGTNILDNLITAFVKDISSEFSIITPNTAKGIGLRNAYAIAKSSCLKDEAKNLILIGTQIPELYLNMLNVSEISSMEVLQQKYILIAILAHEIAHLKQAEVSRKLGIENKLNARELELHADFLAGWYIQKHKNTNQSIGSKCPPSEKPNKCSDTYKNLKPEEKEFAILAATEKFYKIGGKTHGRYEDRLYWLSMGLRFANNNKSFLDAYKIGEKLLVNERDLFKEQ
jgi:hypothetical protein